MMPWVPLATKIVSPSQVAPQGASTLHRVTGEPPPIAIFRSRESPYEKNPTHCPSGEKNGLAASRLVPGIGFASTSPIDRRYSWRLAAYTIRAPSGEMATTATFCRVAT